MVVQRDHFHAPGRSCLRSFQVEPESSWRVGLLNSVSLLDQLAICGGFALPEFGVARMRPLPCVRVPRQARAQPTAKLAGEDRPSPAVGPPKGLGFSCRPLHPSSNRAKRRGHGKPETER